MEPCPTEMKTHNSAMKTKAVGFFGAQANRPTQMSNNPIDTHITRSITNNWEKMY